MDDVAGTSLTPNRSGGAAKKIIILLGVVLILAGVAFGGASFLRSTSGTTTTPTPFPTQEPTPTIEETPTPEASPTATPRTSRTTVTPTKKPTATPTKAATSSASTSSTNTKGLTIRVLNGSGVAGKAGTAADYLKGLGYGIAGTGNADNYDYEKTVITIKKSKESLLATLKSDLSKSYEVGTTSATLSTTAEYDAEVIIGKN